MRVITIFIVLFSITQAQVDDKLKIISSNLYYYGTGVSQNVTEARDLAMEELTTQIAVQVASSFERKLNETSVGIDENVKSVLKTHTTATLKNVHHIKSALADGRIEVFCYLKKSEVEQIFEERKKLIADMAGKAKDFVSQGNVSFGLKLYYFANLLLNSIPDEFVKYHGINYTLEIPNRINELIMQTKFSFLESKKINEKEREITLHALYQGKPVTLLDFNFWDGANQVSVQARDGLATLLLFGASVNFKELKLNVKYAYYENRNEYALISDLWPLIKHPVFSSNKIVKLVKTDAASVEEIDKERNEALAKVADESISYNVKNNIEQEANKFFECVKSPTAFNLNNPYINDAYLSSKIKNYIKNNNPQVLDEKLNANINKTDWGYELRSIRMLHNYPSIPKTSTEYLVLDFDKEGKLKDLNLSISNNQFAKFIKQAEYGHDWGNRQVIIKFLEKYRTAYLTRDIETIDMMFAEDALIIIGREIKRKQMPDQMVQYTKLDQQPDYEYIKLKKADYIKRQMDVFRIQQDIALDFGSLDIIKKNNVDNVYGVEMRQSYASTTYADEGYLFLLIDFNEQDPLIYVRAWQPNSWSEEELIKTANFRIYR